MLRLAKSLKHNGNKGWLSLLILAFLFYFPSKDLRAADPDVFKIEIDQTVSPNQPGPGAGNIGVHGEQDIYTFQGSPGKAVFLDLLLHDPNLDIMTWEVFDPTGKSISLQCFACRDHGFLTLPRTGEYRIVVGRSDLKLTGDYVFRLYGVPEPEVFEIGLGEEVKAGLPDLEGAGMIESPGARDEYRFEVESGQKIVFRLIEYERTIEKLNWSLSSPALGTLFSDDLDRYEPEIITLTESGTYSLIIGDLADPAIGSYRFFIEEIPPPDEILVDVTEALELNEDLPGGGKLQIEGSPDVYLWSIDEPGWIFLDLVDADRALQFAQWQLLGPGNLKVLSTFFFSGDPGLIFLPAAGDYQMIVGGNVASGIGSYRIHLQPVPANEEFSIRMGELVSINQPAEGAGHIGVPGAQDIYRFEANAGQTVFVESLQAERALGFLSWRMLDSEGNLVFEECLRCKDPGLFVLPRSGEYQIIVGGSQHAGTGTYAFRVWDVPEPELYNKEDQSFSVKPGVGEPGEGELNAPGEVDTFLIHAAQKETWHFRPTHGSGSPSLMWRLRNPAGNILFDEPLRAAASFAQFITVEQPGTYRLECYHASTTSATYGFDFEKLEHCPIAVNEGAPPLPALSIASPQPEDIFSDPIIEMVGSIGETAGVRGIDLVLALDSSESLQKTDPEDLRSSAAKAFVRAMPEGLNIRIALVDFDQSARLIQPLTDDFDRVISQLDQLDQSGGTNIEQALQVSVDEILTQTDRGVARSIILFSDGENSIGNAADATFRASEEGIKVHTVYLGADPSQGSALLQTISSATCANYRHAKSAAQLVSIFKNIGSPVPIKRMEASTSAQPDQTFPIDFVGQFWGVSDIPVRSGDSDETELTIRLFTDEQPERMVEKSITVQYASMMNQAPVLSEIPTLILNEDRSRSFALHVSDPDNEVSELSWSFSTDRPDLFPDGSGWRLRHVNGRNRLTLSPVTDGSGQASGKIRVTDPDGAFSESTFGINVREINDAPFFEPIRDIVLNPGQSGHVISLQGIHDGSVFEEQALQFAVVAKNQALIASPEMIYDGHSQTAELRIAPVTDADGATQVEVILSDGASVNGTFLREFEVTVLPKPNQSPTIQWANPQNGTKIFLGDSIDLEVTASDPDGLISSIQFFANGDRLPKPSRTNSSHTWKPDTIGVYQMRATVEDDKQAIHQTPTITIEVVERPPEFSLSVLTPQDYSIVCLGGMVDIEVELDGGDAEGNVVHFYAGDELQGVRNAPPYLFQWEADEIGDFLLTAVAFREDGSTVVSEPIRAGVSDTCFQVAILADDRSQGEIPLIKEYLYDMGVGSHVVPLGEMEGDALDAFDLAMIYVDEATGVQASMLQGLTRMKSNFEKPIFILGHRVATHTQSLTAEETKQWQDLIHLQPFGTQLLTEPLELQESGFFRSILDGRFGNIEPFLLVQETDRTIADDASEVIGFSGETDLVVRSPAGNEPDFGQARTVTFNFSLTGSGDAHSEIQRRRLFQNAICWALRCGGCSNAILPVLPVSWTSEAQTGEQVRQVFRFVNNGACELTGGRVLLSIPEGLILEDVIMSQGLGWRRSEDQREVILDLGRLTSGALGGVQTEILLRAVTPGDYQVSICSLSNNTDKVCTEQPIRVKGEQLAPPKIVIRRSLEGNLSLVVLGTEEGRYRIEVSSDFVNWSHFGNAEGSETTFPVPTNDQGVPLTLFYRASLRL